jgi:hypothetical protein
LGIAALGKVLPNGNYRWTSFKIVESLRVPNKPPFAAIAV